MASQAYSVASRADAVHQMVVDAVEQIRTPLLIENQMDFLVPTRTQFSVLLSERE